MSVETSRCIRCDHNKVIYNNAPEADLLYCDKGMNVIYGKPGADTCHKFTLKYKSFQGSNNQPVLLLPPMGNSNQQVETKPRKVKYRMHCDDDLFFRMVK